MPTPTHEEITRRAETLWLDKGKPSGCDDEIWLQAERELSAKPDGTLGESHSDHAQAELAASQRKEALAPKRPTKSAPKSQPAETGKPLWSQPHSR
ncbi:DUF2934 domain-containing protein [Rariglobus hedericola]|uniref:DUF2934 domain-containing protein n=1 Tax=Rariglobus hedericola TaxID=2597822 RepID=A0A556QK32_9BACT|nr:DUF2934 domain-containing protein [Rariglobus hedericola]TSJ77013.1 DUF2934 domain-containing protein [Rariglobus hedericola]